MELRRLRARYAFRIFYDVFRQLLLLDFARVQLIKSVTYNFLIIICVICFMESAFDDAS